MLTLNVYKEGLHADKKIWMETVCWKCIDFTWKQYSLFIPLMLSSFSWLIQYWLILKIHSLSGNNHKPEVETDVYFLFTLTFRAKVQVSLGLKIFTFCCQG